MHLDRAAQLIGAERRGITARTPRLSKTRQPRANTPAAPRVRDMRLRFRRWWPAIPAILAVLTVYAAWPGRFTFTVSPETTYVTEPVDGMGYVDYPTALNERTSAGVTPENNALVLIVQALGPRPEGVPLPPDFYKWLGIEPPPDDGEYLISREKYFDAHLKEK